MAYLLLISSVWVLCPFFHNVSCFVFYTSTVLFEVSWQKGTIKEVARFSVIGGKWEVSGKLAERWKVAGRRSVECHMCQLDLEQKMKSGRSKVRKLLCRASGATGMVAMSSC